MTLGLCVVDVARAAAPGKVYRTAQESLVGDAQNEPANGGAWWASATVAACSRELVTSRAGG